MPMDKSSTTTDPRPPVYTHSRIVDIRGLLAEEAMFDILFLGLQYDQMRYVVMLLTAEDLSPIQTVQEYIQLDKIIELAISTSIDLQKINPTEEDLTLTPDDVRMEDLYEEILDFNETAKAFIQSRIPVKMEGFEATRWVGPTALLIEYNGPLEHDSSSTYRHIHME